jgi:vacuolar-type H+-ATPase subunit H
LRVACEKVRRAFSLEKEMDEHSPLVIIAEHERVCADRLANAQQAANRAVIEARHQAERRREQAERDGQAEANAIYANGLAAADAQAAELRAEGERAAAQLTERGRASLEQAVTRMLEIVLPACPGSEDGA